MRLLIDIGNTRLKWALLANGELLKQHALVYQEELLSEQLAQRWSKLTPPTGIHIVSVASKEVVQNVIEWVTQRWACPVDEIKSGIRCGKVVNGYTRPESLGVDRWAAIISAYETTCSAVCVVDCGTAITCDLVDSHGNHLGGAILPGLEMLRNALMENTAGIQQIRDSSRITTLWGRDTESCINVGRIQASVGLIERMVLQARNQLEEPVMTVLTGGDAAVLLPWLSFPCRYEADLVLQGVARIVMEQRA